MPPFFQHPMKRFGDRGGADSPRRRQSRRRGNPKNTGRTNARTLGLSCDVRTPIDMRVFWQTRHKDHRWVTLRQRQPLKDKQHYIAFSTKYIFALELLQDPLRLFSKSHFSFSRELNSSTPSCFRRRGFHTNKRTHDSLSTLFHFSIFFSSSSARGEAVGMIVIH